MSNTIIVAIIGSGALSALISGIFQLLNKRSEKKSGLEKGVQLLLLDRLREQGKEYLADGHISTEEMKAYDELYRAYHALGGNGFADTIYNKVKGLPIEADFR